MGLLPGKLTSAGARFMAESRRVPGSALILASASPRRAELLTAAGIPFEVRPAHIDEAFRPGEEARTYASRVAVEKAQAVAAGSPGRPVLAADTVVVIDGQILGKPADSADAKRMLRLLSGRTHEVLTAVVLIAGNDPGGDFPKRTWKSPPGSYSAVEVTAVEFVLLSRAEIDWYVATGEPLDKAGAYAIQGLASRFVTRIEGSYSNVVGLPVGLVYAMCSRAGILLS
jgi:septum formation protein